MSNPIFLKNVTAKLAAANKPAMSDLLVDMASVNQISEANTPEENLLSFIQFNILFAAYYNDNLIQNAADWAQPGVALTRVVRQIECIALLTGVICDVSSHPTIAAWHRLPHLKKLAANNFLYRQPYGLAFKHFDRALLTLQLLVRLLDPTKIKQGRQSLCGPTSFMQCIAESNPKSYIEYVTGLAEKGQIKMSLDEEAPGLSVKVKNNRLFDHSPETIRRNTDLQEADFVALVVLRENKNFVFTFTDSTNLLKRMLFGNTFPFEIAQWLVATGYHHLEPISLRTPEDIMQCSKLLKLGYTCIYFTTGEITKAILNGNFSIRPGPISAHLDGHFVWLKSIDYDAATQTVAIRISSWGKDSNEVRMPYADFIRLCGSSQAIIGRSPEAEEQFRLTSGWHTHGSNRKHPYAFCTNLVAEINSWNVPASRLPSGIKKLLTEIEENCISLKTGRWVHVAKRIQDDILYLPTSPEFIRLDPLLKRKIKTLIKEYTQQSIIDDATIDEANDTYKRLKSLIPNKQQREHVNIELIRLENFKLDKIEERNMDFLPSIALCAEEYRDIDAIKLLIEFYLKDSMYLPAANILKRLDTFTWANACDKLAAQRTLATGIKQKLLALLNGEATHQHETMVEIRTCMKEITHIELFTQCHALLILTEYKFSGTLNRNKDEEKIALLAKYSRIKQDKTGRNFYLGELDSKIKATDVNRLLPVLKSRELLTDDLITELREVLRVTKNDGRKQCTPFFKESFLAQRIIEATYALLKRLKSLKLDPVFIESMNNKYAEYTTRKISTAELISEHMHGKRITSADTENATNLRIFNLALYISILSLCKHYLDKQDGPAFDYDLYVRNFDTMMERTLIRCRVTQDSAEVTEAAEELTELMHQCSEYTDKLMSPLVVSRASTPSLTPPPHLSIWQGEDDAPSSRPQTPQNEANMSLKPPASPGLGTKKS